MKERNKAVTLLLNGTITSFKSVIPITHQITSPQLLGKSLHLEFGVLIGITGDLKGKLILAGETSVFASIGDKMFGMPVEGEMLASFAGELGNMIAGGIATIIDCNGIKTDITAPTIFSGNSMITGYEKAIQLAAIFDQVGKLDIYLLLD